MKTFAQEIDEARAEASAAVARIAEAESARDAIKAELEKAHANHAADLAASGELVASMQAEIASLRADIEKAQQAIDDEKARANAAEERLALVPAIADATHGVKPVADGTAAGDGSATDWIAECERRHGADRMAFYRANRAAIDAAYAKVK